MNWERVWKNLNQPVSTLLLGSCMGFLFLNLVWGPFERHQAEQIRHQTIREEVAFRLGSIEDNIGKYATDNDIEGGRSFTKSLDPQYKQMSLAGLIHIGWGAGKLRECSQHFKDLNMSAAADIRNPTKVQAAREALNAIREILKLAAT